MHTTMTILLVLLLIFLGLTILLVATLILAAILNAVNPWLPRCFCKFNWHLEPEHVGYRGEGTPTQYGICPRCGLQVTKDGDGLWTRRLNDGQTTEPD